MSGLLQRIFSPFDNPVLRRELRLITRRGRFQWVMALLTVGMTLAIASVGGRAGAGIHPASIGKMLFQTFFGIANGLVLVAGPAIAASSIASEREGRTYEALALTGISPVEVARGKFLAAFTNVGAYVVALAPVGALPFLFGGVSALSMVYAFGMLAVITALATLAGLAISARVPTTRVALITSVLGGTAMAYALYQIGGSTIGYVVCYSVGMSFPGTIWLPVLLADGTLSALQRLVLIAGPLTFALLLGWFMFEICTANLSDQSADRTTGIKRWYVATVIIGSAIACATIPSASSREDRSIYAIVAIAGFTLFAVVAAFVFQGDAINAPRRVRLQWKARGAGMVRRFFGPGVTSSAALQLGAASIAIAVISAAGLIFSLADEYGPAQAPLAVIAFALPATTFILFIVGVSMFLRVRWGTAVSRVVTAVLLVLLLVAPYAITTIMGGEAADPDSIVPLLASPSPIFFFQTAAKIASDTPDSDAVLATLIASAIYAVIGLIGLTVGAIQADRIVRALDADAERMDSLMSKEDAQASVRKSQEPVASKA